jgi:hypothetical protein
MRPQNATIGRKLAVLAAKSHGVVTRDELLAAGITQAQIGTRLANGGLIPVHRGSSVLGTPLRVSRRDIWPLSRHAVRVRFSPDAPPRIYSTS